MKGTDMAAWTDSTVRRLRELTTRPIVIRPHPKHLLDLSALTHLPGVTQSTSGHSLQQDLAGAWAAVFCNSSSSVAAALAGVPIFADDDDCVAWAVANSDLALIETPNMPDRTQWLYDLSAAHWTDAESRSGLIYRHFEQYF
jgi:DNA-binding transcriptional LysR family regulator